MEEGTVRGLYKGDTVKQGVLGLVTFPQVEEYRERKGRKSNFWQ